MEARELTILERIARNLPIMKVNYGRTDSEYGTIYFAWGQDASGKQHGVWGLRGMGRTIEFKLGTSSKKVRQVLTLDAHGLISEFNNAGLLREGHFDA